MTKRKNVRNDKTGRFATKEEEAANPDEFTVETVTNATKPVLELLRDISEHLNERPEDAKGMELDKRIQKVLNDG